VNLGCRSETCCVRLAENTGRKKSPSDNHHTNLSSYILAIKAYRQSEKNLLTSNTSFICPHNMVNFGPLVAEIVLPVWGIPAISTGFASWQRYCTLLQQWALAKVCGVEHRAPHIFGRAAITLGIGPHSSFFMFCRKPRL